MKIDTIHFILSEIAKEMQIADLDGQLYLLERKQKLLNKLEKMENENKKTAKFQLKLNDSTGFRADIKGVMSANQYGRITEILHEKEDRVDVKTELLEALKKVQLQVGQIEHNWDYREKNYMPFVTKAIKKAESNA